MNENSNTFERANNANNNANSQALSFKNINSFDNNP